MTNVDIAKSDCEVGTGGGEGGFKVPASGVDGDELIIKSMGYQQQLYRGLGLIKNFSMGFTTVAVLPSIFLTITLSLSSGGPSDVIWGWIVTFTMTLAIGACLAEICSAYPSAGCVYHWAGQLVPRDQVPLSAYICGWLNFAGNCAGDASVAYGFANFLSLALLVSGKAVIGQRQQVGVSISVLFIWGVCNTLRIDRVGWINQMAAVIHISSILIIVVATLSLAPTESTWGELLAMAAGSNSTMSVAPFATGTEVFTGSYNGTGFDSKSYACAIGITAACFGFSGYEASGHIAEETRRATKAAPLGILFTIIATGIGGLALLLTFLFVTPTVDDYFFFGDSSTGNAAVNILLLAAGPAWAEAMMWLVVINFFFAGLGSMAMAARITFALSRDRGFPFGEWVSTVHPTFRSPANALITVFLIESLLLLLPLNTSADGSGDIAFYSIIGVCSIGSQISYAIPIAMKIIYQPEDFPVTELNLGRWSTPLGCLAVAWLLGTSCLFFLPTYGPTVTPQNMNWLIVVVSAFFFFSLLNWIFNSRFYYTGPPRATVKEVYGLATAKMVDEADEDHDHQAGIEIAAKESARDDDSDRA